MPGTKSRAKTRGRTGESAEVFGWLNEIAQNLWWSWNPDAMALFDYAHPEAFAESDRNPVVALRTLPADRRATLARDEDFVHEVARVHGRLRQYLAAETWYARKYGRPSRARAARSTSRFPHSAYVAYFCMEYGLHESLPLYAGGLGVLAGDHLKSASDLGLPLVAVGIYWKRGYTRQHIDERGCQLDRFPHLWLKNTPVREVTTPRGKPVRVKLPIGNETVLAGAYQLDVGRVPLYLLTTDLPENGGKDRRLVEVLYSGNRDMRIRQEILLGIGGWRLLQELGIPVAAYHLNEGHAAFLSLERIVERIRGGVSFRKALGGVHNTTVFTTHTPVPAGNEEFKPDLVDRYLDHYIERMGVTHTAFHDLARVTAGNHDENFGMTPLALRTARHCNGVAALHGAVAREMWKPLYPDTKLKDVPIGHVTNGIHLRTWLHPQMAELLDEYLGEDWEERQDDRKLWARASRIPDEVLWNLHLNLKRQLAENVTQYVPSTGKNARRDAGEPLLDPEALTIGFARRFATYKRATLIFADPKRLARIVNSARRPVQIIFAGKAHPADTDGKNVIQQLINFSRDEKFANRVLFLEDYEMGIARLMTSGVDVWLNNPQRPREASGTSGMKPALHGGLNLSILDGWWPEAYNRKNGWAIGKGENHDGSKSADRRDATELYRLLEREVVPMYYDRDAKGLPHRWIAAMKNTLVTIPPVFNTHRQVKEYLTKLYLPAMRKA